MMNLDTFIVKARMRWRVCYQYAHTSREGSTRFRIGEPPLPNRRHSERDSHELFYFTQSHFLKLYLMTSQLPVYQSHRHCHYRCCHIHFVLRNWIILTVIITHVCSKVMVLFCMHVSVYVSVCVSIWAVTFECLDTETSFLVW